MIGDWLDGSWQGPCLLFPLLLCLLLFFPSLAEIVMEKPYLFGISVYVYSLGSPYLFFSRDTYNQPNHYFAIAVPLLLVNITLHVPVMDIYFLPSEQTKQDFSTIIDKDILLPMLALHSNGTPSLDQFRPQTYSKNSWLWSESSSQVLRSSHAHVSIGEDMSTSPFIETSPYHTHGMKHILSPIVRCICLIFLRVALGLAMVQVHRTSNRCTMKACTSDYGDKTVSSCFRISPYDSVISN